MLHAADRGIVFENARIGICLHRGRSKYPDVFRQIFRRDLRRASSDERSGAAIRAGVVAAMCGVGLQQADLIDGRRQRGRGDLAMHRRGAVAEFHRSDRELEATILPQRNPGVGDMSGRRDGIDHGERDAFADQPVGVKISHRSFCPHRTLDQIEALIEAVAAINHVVVFRSREAPASDRRISRYCGGEFQKD